MKSTVARAGALASLVCAASAACSTQSNVAVTFFGWPDNDPPSAQTAYSCSSRGFIAGGTGTYANPLTFASAAGEFNSCEIIYLPYLKKYLRYEDYCQQCTDDWSSGKHHIDIWTGSNTGSGGATQVACENTLTPDADQTLVRDPATNLEVNTASLFASGVCNTGATFPNADASSYCSGGGSTCTWVGHCAGASCSTNDDCSDVLVCTSGICSSSSTTCSWVGHCAGASCSTSDDCSDVLTCNGGVCG